MGTQTYSLIYRAMILKRRQVGNENKDDIFCWNTEQHPGFALPVACLLQPETGPLIIAAAIWAKLFHMHNCEQGSLSSSGCILMGRKLLFRKPVSNSSQVNWPNLLRPALLYVRYLQEEWVYQDYIRVFRIHQSFSLGTHGLNSWGSIHASIRFLSQKQKALFAHWEEMTWMPHKLTPYSV